MPDRDAIEAGGEWEVAFAARIGGKPQPGSGNQFFARLDVAGRSLLASLKRTRIRNGQPARSFSLTKGMIEEMRDAVLGPGGVGADTLMFMAIDIDGYEVAVLELQDLLSLITEPRKLIVESKNEAKRARAKVPYHMRED